MAKAQGVSQLTQKRLRRGVFHSVPELVAAIEAYLQHYNENPTPFVWTATADAILEKIGKCTVILETLHQERRAERGYIRTTCRVGLALEY